MARIPLEPVITKPVVRKWDLSGLRIHDACYPPLYRMAPHIDDRTRVSLLVAGTVEEFSDGVPHLSGPGSAVLKPGDTIHTDRLGPISEYICRLRILNAAELLAVSDRPPAHIALTVGFTDQSHFCHAFRRETGITPLAYRVGQRRREVAFLQSPAPASVYHGSDQARDQHPGDVDSPRR